MSMPPNVAVTPYFADSRVTSATSAACSSALVGMQPTCRQVPPTLPFSMRPDGEAELAGAQGGCVAAASRTQHDKVKVLLGHPATPCACVQLAPRQGWRCGARDGKDFLAGTTLLRLGKVFCQSEQRADDRAGRALAVHAVGAAGVVGRSGDVEVRPRNRGASAPSPRVPDEVPGGTARRRASRRPCCPGWRSRCRRRRCRACVRSSAGSGMRQSVSPALSPACDDPSGHGRRRP